MANEYWELQTQPKNVSRRAKVLLPEDLGQLVSALLRDSKRSKPLPGDVFDQVTGVYKNADLAHPAYTGELGKYMAILTAQVAQLLQKNDDPKGIKGGDFPKPANDFDIIQQAQKMATLRYVSKQVSRSPVAIEVPNAPWRTIYDAGSGLLCTLEKGEPRQKKCYAFLTDIILPEGAHFSQITDTGIFMMPIMQKGVKKMVYIGSGSAHEIRVSEIEEDHNVMSFKTWGDTPHVAIPNPDKPGEYIHEKGALEGVFGGDMVVIKTENALIVRDTSGVFRCEIGNHFTPVTEGDGIRLEQPFEAEVRLWHKDNTAEPLAKLSCNTGFLNFSDFREIVRQGK